MSARISAPSCLGSYVPRHCREVRRAVGVAKNSVRTRRVPVTFRRRSSLPPSLSLPPLPLSRPPVPRYSHVARRYVVCVCATGSGLYVTASRFSRVIVVDHPRGRDPRLPRRSSSPSPLSGKVPSSELSAERRRSSVGGGGGGGSSTLPPRGLERATSSGYG